MGVGIIDNTAVGGGIGVTVSNGQMAVALGTDAENAPHKIGGVRMFSEVDNGSATGSPLLLSPEVDDDYRMRTANDLVLDTESYNYAAQNTGKHTYATSTLTAAWTTAGFVTNSGASTAAGGLTMGTYREFGLFGSGSLYAEFEASFSNQPAANATIDFGLFRRGAATAYAPADGAYFSLRTAGMYGVVNFNGTETPVALTGFTYVLNQKYQCIVSITEREVEFWIDNTLYARIATPVGQGQPFMSSTLPLSVRQVHTTTAGAALAMALSDYTVSYGGPLWAETLGSRNNAILGSYQGLSGGTIGKLIAGTVTTGTLVAPTAAVPVNTALTANLPNGLGGKALETFTTPLALATDGILCSYQIPAGTISVQGRTLKLRCIKLAAYVSTVMVGGPFVNEFKLAFGHTAVSLQTGEAIAAKAPRLVMLPAFTHVVGAAQAVTTILGQGKMEEYFEEPIYVNPGEFLQLIVRHEGTAATSGVITYLIQYDYSWE